MTTANELAAERANEASISLMAKAEGFEITEPAEFEASGELLREIKAKQKEVGDTRTAITRPMDEAKRRVMELFAPVSQRLISAEQKIKAAMLEFTTAEQRRQRDEQAKLDRLAKIERDRLDRRAETARETGKEEKAEVLEETAAAVHAPLAAPKTKAAGVHTRTTWKAEVTDKAALIKAAAEDPQIARYILVDMRNLNALARAMKADLSIPGVRAVSEETVSARA